MRSLVRFSTGARQNSFHYVLCFLAVLLTVTVSWAQTGFKKLKEFPTEEVSKVSVDRLGDFYLVMKKGTIRKYDTEGNFMGEFANPELLTVTVLEPWNPLRVFIYSRNNQEITLLDHSLAVQQKIAVDPAWAIEPFLASPSIDNDFWVLDNADKSLKRIDHQTKAVAREVSLKMPAGSDPDFIFLREYQNLIFLIDWKSGVLIFSTVGNLIHKIESRNLEYIGFLGEEFYYLEEGKLKFYDLYTEERHEITVDPSARFIYVTDERMILVRSAAVEIDEFKQ